MFGSSGSMKADNTHKPWVVSNEYQKREEMFWNSRIKREFCMSFELNLLNAGFCVSMLSGKR